MRILVYFAELAGHMGTDAALESVLLLAHSHPFVDERLNDEVRTQAIGVLRYFPQKRLLMN